MHWDRKTDFIGLFQNLYERSRVFYIFLKRKSFEKDEQRKREKIDCNAILKVWFITQKQFLWFKFFKISLYQCHKETVHRHELSGKSFPSISVKL